MAPWPLWGAPVLLLAGDLDVNSPPSAVAELARAFPDARLRTCAGAGHFPWLDAPTWFAETVAGFVHDVP